MGSLTLILQKGNEMNIWMIDSSKRVLVGLVIITSALGLHLLKAPMAEGAPQPYSGSCPDVNLVQCTGQGCGFLWLGSCTWKSYWGYDPAFGFWGIMYHCTCVIEVSDPLP